MEITERLASLSQRLIAQRVSGEILLQNGDQGFASAPSNIALIKYWGKEEGRSQIPVNGSVSYTLGSFRSTTCVQVRGRFFPEGESPVHPRLINLLRLGDGPEGEAPQKMSRWLFCLTAGWGDDIAFRIESSNSFPTACGMASSASGYAALTGALADLLQLERRFSRDDLQYWLMEWARLGSGSATRSAILSSEPSFVAWERVEQGSRTREWTQARVTASQLGHCVVVIDSHEKSVSSSDGHSLARSSHLQTIRVAGIPRRMELMERALCDGNWDVMRDLAEADAFALHAVMQSGDSRLSYFGETTARFIAEFVTWRDKSDTRAFWTLDAGPNIHLLYHVHHEKRVREFLGAIVAKNNDVSLLFGERGPGLVLGRAL